MGDLVDALFVALAVPVLFRWVHAPQAILLWLALPPLLSGSPSAPAYSSDRYHHLIISTIPWALSLTELALAPV